MAESKPITVAYLSYDGLTDPLGQSQIMPYLEGLSKLNYRFTVFSFEKPERFEKLHQEVAAWAIINGISWIPLKYHKIPPIFSTLFDVWVLWRAFKKSHSITQFKVVHCRSYITSLIGLHAKRAFQVKFIIDMRGFWADERVEGGLWNLANPLYRYIYNFFKTKEKQFIVEADHIIILTENGKHEIKSWGLKNSPITVIPTCVDLEHFNPQKIKAEDQETLRRQLGINEGDFVLLYLGSWGTWYLTEEMLKVFDQIKEKVKSAKFLIVTPDAVQLSRPKHPNDILVTRSTRHEVPLHISLANLAVFYIKPTYSKKASSATKLGEILAMGIPTITNRGWGDTEFFDFGDQLRIQRIEDPISLDWIKTRAESTPNLDQLSLLRGINSYNLVYRSLLVDFQ
jgi:hypothetical protein